MKKQFIWFLTDTTRYDMIGCYKYPQMQTPNLDRLAAKGMKFEYTYCCQPVCGPSRSTIFTGLYPHANGMWANSMALNGDIKTLGQWLSEFYIPCGYIGKWHLDEGDYFGKGKAPDGWDKDSWYDMRNYLEELSITQRVRIRKPKSAGTVPASMTFAYRCASKAIQYIEKHKEEDYFLVVSFDEPHGPSVCPEPYASMDIDYEVFRSPAYKDMLKDKPQYQKLWAGTNVLGKADGSSIRPYGLVECNSFADAQFGRVIDYAEKESPDAVFLYTADHGDALKAHNLAGKGDSVYDEIARVPLIIKGPGIASGITYSHVISQIDLTATALDYFTGTVPKEIQGKSLLPVLSQPEIYDSRPAFIEFGRFCCRSDQFGSFQPMRGMITDQYKIAIQMTGEGELYDVKKDPYNLNNLYYNSSYHIIKLELFHQLMEWMKETKDPFYGPYWKCTSE